MISLRCWNCLFTSLILIAFFVIELNGETVNIYNDVENVNETLSTKIAPTKLANFTELTKMYGYESEEHTVVTDDGYILSLFRIPRGKDCKDPIRKPPVLLMHGLLQSSDSWIDAGPSAGLVFLISDSCFDLWAANVRGNYYGRRHVRLDPDKDSEFWDFGADEMGRFDLPAIIDYILKKSYSNQLNYVGYSQGGRIFFIMCSETFGYCEKVKVSINVAPGTRYKYSRSIPVRSSSVFYAVIEPSLKTPKELEVLPRGGLMQSSISSICRDYILARTFRKYAIFFIDSPHLYSISSQTVMKLYEHFPAGTSARNMAIKGQNAEKGEFRKYDYGLEENLKIYGKTEPPKYDLNLTNIPVVIIYGENDFLVDPKDAKWLAKQLPNVIELYQVKNPMWTHFDNVYSSSTNQWIFPKIREYLLKYSQF